MHCYNSSTPTKSEKDHQRINSINVRDNGKKLASVYEKKPFFVRQRRWDTKTVLPKIYKLQSNDPCNKFKAKIHNDDGLLEVDFTLDKTITEFIRASEKLNLDYVTSFAEFGNLLLGRYQTDWKQVLHEHFPEPVDTEVVRPAQDCNLAENFSCAIDLFFTCTLNKKKLGIASTFTWRRVETMASVRSYIRALWTTSIILKKCFVSQSFSPREISPSPTTHCRCSGSTCCFIALTAQSTSAVGASSTTRHCRLSRSTSRVFFSLSLVMA